VYVFLSILFDLAESLPINAGRRIYRYASITQVAETPVDAYMIVYRPVLLYSKVS